MALLTGVGVDIHYLCATRGEGGERGEPPVCSRDKIGFVRQRELTCAIQALGGGTLSFLGYIDPIIGENQELYPYASDQNDLASRIRDHIETICPDVILTHGSNGEYGHPGHILTHKGVCQAVKDLGRSSPLLYTFCATFLNHPRPRHANPDDPAHIIVDVTPAIGQKIRAAYCHRSQHALFLRRRSLLTGYRLTIPEILLNIESFHRTNLLSYYIYTLGFKYLEVGYAAAVSLILLAIILLFSLLNFRLAGGESMGNP